MTKSLSALLVDLRDRIGETSASEWADAELTRYLNDGQQDIARRTETLQKVSTIAAVAGTQQYTLPTDLVRVYRVEYIPTGQTQTYPLTYRDFNSLDSVWWAQQTQTQGTPQLFTMWGFTPNLKLIAYPIPSVAGTFNVYYYRLPVSMTSGADTCEVPEGWTDLVVTYAEYVALRKDHDPRWQEAKQLYEQSIQTMLDMTRRWSDQGGMIVPDTGSPAPAWLVGGGFDGF